MEGEDRHVLDYESEFVVVPPPRRAGTMGKFKSTSKAVLAERRIERKMKKIAKKRAKDDTIDPMTGCVGPARRRRCRPVRPVVASRSFSRA